MAFSQEQINQAASDFDRLFAEASRTREEAGLGDNNRPQMEPGGDPVAHLQREAAFNNQINEFNRNPLRPMAQQLRDARARDIAGGMAEADAERLHQARISQMRDTF